MLVIGAEMPSGCLGVPKVAKAGSGVVFIVLRVALEVLRVPNLDRRTGRAPNTTFTVYCSTGSAEAIQHGAELVTPNPAPVWLAALDIG